MKLKILFTNIFLFIFNLTFCQSIPVGSYSDLLVRKNQISDVESIPTSFTQHPLNSGLISKNDSAFQKMIASCNLIPKVKIFGNALSLKILPFTLINEYNAKLPFGYNNGPLYPNVGLQSMCSGGFYLKWGIVNIQLKPEFVHAQNKAFSTFSDINNNSIDNARLIDSYFFLINGIDAPERFGSNALSYAGLGQSKLTLIYKNMELGVSTENLWWGPGTYNSIMMSNSAPGFLHWTFNSSKPMNNILGTFEWQLIGGKLKQSGYLPFDLTKSNYDLNLYKPKPFVNRYLSGFTANWHPKWINGFFIGISGYDYLNIDSSYIARGLVKKIIPVFSPSAPMQNSLEVGGDGQDFAYAINIRQLFSSYHAEIYFEYARNDAAGSVTDFILQPEHSTAYTIGSSRYFEINKNQFIKVNFELTHLQSSDTFLLRDEPTWYVHSGYKPQDGYTNLGRYIGAGIGPGSNSLIFDISYFYKINSFGLKFERFVHNNDLFYTAYSKTIDNNDTEWVDVSSTIYTNIKLDKFLISAEFAPIFTYNYEYQNSINIHNNHARINLTYFFD